VAGVVDTFGLKQGYWPEDGPTRQLVLWETNVCLMHDRELNRQTSGSHWLQASDSGGNRRRTF
jgi:hypothetical protein